MKTFAKTTPETRTDVVGKRYFPRSIYAAEIPFWMKWLHSACMTLPLLWETVFNGSLGKSARCSAMFRKPSDDEVPSVRLASWIYNNAHSSGSPIAARHRSGLPGC